MTNLPNATNSEGIHANKPLKIKSQNKKINKKADVYYLFFTQYRSHHEKLVIVDYQICFIGGLDLCFGRYDTSEHKVGDCPPLIWPGKDYYNPRYVPISDFINLTMFSLP